MTAQVRQVGSLSARSNVTIPAGLPVPGDGKSGSSQVNAYGRAKWRDVLTKDEHMP
jgi:hypothetical protein